MFGWIWLVNIYFHHQYQSTFLRGFHVRFIVEEN